MCFILCGFFGSVLVSIADFYVCLFVCLFCVGVCFVVFLFSFFLYFWVGFFLCVWIFFGKGSSEKRKRERKTSIHVNSLQVYVRCNPASNSLLLIELTHADTFTLDTIYLCLINGQLTSVDE